MALLTSDCGTTRVHEHQMALITSGMRAPLQRALEPADAGKVLSPMESSLVEALIRVDRLELRRKLVRIGNGLARCPGTVVLLRLPSPLKRFNSTAEGVSAF